MSPRCIGHTMDTTMDDPSIDLVLHIYGSRAEVFGRTKCLATRPLHIDCKLPQEQDQSPHYSRQKPPDQTHMQLAANPDTGDVLESDFYDQEGATLDEGMARKKSLTSHYSDQVQGEHYFIVLKKTDESETFEGLAVHCLATMLPDSVVRRVTIGIFRFGSPGSPQWVGETTMGVMGSGSHPSLHIKREELAPFLPCSWWPGNSHCSNMELPRGPLSGLKEKKDMYEYAKRQYFFSLIVRLSNPAQSPEIENPSSFLMETPAFQVTLKDRTASKKKNFHYTLPAFDADCKLMTTDFRYYPLFPGGLHGLGPKLVPMQATPGQLEAACGPDQTPLGDDHKIRPLSAFTDFSHCIQSTKPLDWDSDVTDEDDIQHGVFSNYWVPKKDPDPRGLLSQEGETEHDCSLGKGKGCGGHKKRKKKDSPRRSNRLKTLSLASTDDSLVGLGTNLPPGGHIPMAKPPRTNSNSSDSQPLQDAQGWPSSDEMPRWPPWSPVIRPGSPSSDSSSDLLNDL